jgi:hypothetical protein
VVFTIISIDPVVFAGIVIACVNGNLAIKSEATPLIASI